MRLINILYVPEFFLCHYDNNMTSGIFAGHNHDDHPIYGNILCMLKVYRSHRVNEEQNGNYRRIEKRVDESGGGEEESRGCVGEVLNGETWAETDGVGGQTV